MRRDSEPLMRMEFFVKAAKLYAKIDPQLISRLVSEIIYISQSMLLYFQELLSIHKLFPPNKEVFTLLLPESLVIIISNAYFQNFILQRIVMYYLSQLQKLSYLYQQMGLIQKIIGLIPRPFRYIQRKLDIQKQWAQFKSNLRPHKYKIIGGSLIVMYPLYSSYLHQGIGYTKLKIGKYIKQSTEPTQPAFQWTQNLIKHLLQHIFADPRVKDEAMDFLFSILKDEKFYNNILQLLISALQSESFMRQLKVAVKEILIQQLKDQQVRTSINQFLVSLSQNERVKFAFIKLIQNVFSSKESQQTMVNLLKKGVSNQQVKQALGESVNFAVREVLSDQQTLNQLKIFIFFLLRKFQNDDEIKGMMDILFAKGLGLVKKKKDPELDKFLRPKKTDAI